MWQHPLMNRLQMEPKVGAFYTALLILTVLIRLTHE
jgi:hypothetical protein